MVTDIDVKLAIYRWFAAQARRPTADARRPQPGEFRRIFAGLGLHDAFWDPPSDTFQTGARHDPPGS